MFRQFYPIAFLLMLIVSDDAFGARRLGFRRTCCRGHNSRISSSCACAPTGCACEPTYGARFCIQSLIFDVPGSIYDYYDCLKYPTGCGGSYSAIIWRGNPSNLPLPQICSLSNDNCEGQRFGEDAWSGHGLNLDTREKAWKVIDAGFSAANIDTSKIEREYYKIPKSQVPAGVGRDVYVLAAEVPTTAATKEKLYFCLEWNPPSGSPVDPATFSECDDDDLGPGRKLRIEFTAHGENRVGDVWLRE